MSKRSRQLRAPFERAAIHIAMAIIPRLPRRAVLLLAWTGGWLGYRFDARGRQVGLANLDVAFGDEKTRMEKKKILKKSFVTMARTLLDTFWFAHHSDKRLGKYVAVADNSNVFFKDCAHICMTAHFGNWEIIGQMSGHKGRPLSSIATPVKNPIVNKYFIRAREATGQQIIPREGALRKLLGILRKKGKVAFLADQNTREDEGGIWVEFFGLPAPVTAAPALLAGRTGTEILMGFCRPEPNGRYYVYAGETLAPPANTDEEAILETTQRITRLTEQEIRKHPEHWLWMYKRWKTKKPGHELAEYPFYAGRPKDASQKE